MASDPAELGRRLREGDRSAAPAALNAIENRADREAARELLAELSPAALGTFLAAIPQPMALGEVELDDDSTVVGFLCEPLALDGAEVPALRARHRAAEARGRAGRR